MHTFEDMLFAKPKAPSTPACDICDGHNNVKGFPAAITGVAIAMCYPCFEVWYDGGETDPAVIRQKSLANQGLITI
jgi:Zn-finger nucleic acid-binding protein